MKRAKTLWMMSCLCLFLVSDGYSQSDDPSLIIDQISIQSGLISTIVVLQSKVTPPLFPSYYSKEHPSTIVLELGQTTVNANQPFPLAEDLIVQDIIVEVDKAGRSLLLLPLEKKVPYRVYTNQNMLMIELHKFQNDRASDFVPPDVIERLEDSPDTTAYLKSVDITENTAQIEVRAKLNEEAVVDVFALESPCRLVADLYRVADALPPPSYEVNRGGLRKLRIGQFRVSDPCLITRMVFDLEEPGPYTMSWEKGKLLISFPHHPTEVKGKTEDQVSDSKETVSQEIPETSVPEKPGPVETLIATADTTIGAQSLEESNGDNQTASSDLPEPVKTKDDVKSTRALFSPQTIGFTGEKYAGELVDLKFKEADLRDVVLYLGAEVAGLNVVFDPGVRGTVTCSLVAVPWDQALDILLKNNKMGRVIDGNVLRVAPVDVLSREKEDEKRMLESKEFTEPILIRQYPLSYAKAEDVQLLIENKLSERGEIIVDKRTNTLIISDIEDRISIVEQLLTAFDKATPQVTIEARIVEATSTFVRNLGIQWGWRGISDPFYGNQTSLQFPNKVLVDGSLIPQGSVTKGIGGPLGGYAINLPAPAFSTAVGLSLSNVLDTFGLDMALSALETSGNGKVLSRPTVTTQNNVQAEIIQGSQIPVQTSANFTVITTFVNAALELRARPQITEAGTIVMYLEIRNNSPDFGNLVNGIPPITMQSATTTVMIPDGGTTVIGGIYQTENSVTRDRVPFLGKIPLLGSLFRSSARTEKSRELLIFITPRIIRN